MIEGLKRRRQRLDSLPPNQRSKLSPALYGLHLALVPFLEEEARGRVLDVGCGAMPYRQIVSSHVTDYHGLDVEERGVALEYLSDAQDMSTVPDSSYDFVMAIEVIEHVPRPGAVLAEIHRVLKPGGQALISAPHLSRIHEAPHDYLRFTGDGLSSLLGEYGFEVRSIQPTGGLFAFLGHQVSMPLMSILSNHCWLLRVGLWANLVLLIAPARSLDRLLNTSRLFPLGHVAVGVKPADRTHVRS